MQSITHFFSGVFLLALLQYLVAETWLQYVLLFPLGVALHFIIDALVEITYHPPTARTRDKFWITWHVIVVVGTVIVAIVFWIPYAWGMFAAYIPDIVDWGITRPFRTYVLKKPVPADPKEFPRHFFHYWIGRFRDKCFPWLPDWTEKRRGIVPEIGIWIICTAIVIFVL